jgi:hypothetical protein
MIPLAIFSKLLADTLVSLYPTIVKNIKIKVGLQIWTRFFIYACFSFFLVDRRFIYEQLLSGFGIFLSLVTIINVYSAYTGFELLEGGIAYALYYTYPIMIVLFSGEIPGFSMCLALLGIFILYKSNETRGIEKDNKDKESDKEANKEGDKENDKDNENQPTTEPNTLQKITKELVGKFEHSIFPNKKAEGYFMIFLAALAQASIYFLIRRIKTKNHWNHLFISYFFGAVFLSLYYFQEIQTFGLVSHLSLSLLLNICVGLAGYILRFYAMYRLSPNLYAPLSYFGVVMAVLYGILFNAEKINNLKILGVSCVLLSNVIAVINAYHA